MNLVIDQGNTVTKIAVFNEEGLQELFLYDLFDLQACKSLLNTTGFLECCIFSSVANVPSDILTYLDNNFAYFLFLNRDVSLPIKNMYQSPDTLGSDRIAAIVGAKEIYPDNNILVIDIGTAITYDFVDEGNAFRGGNISPGIKQRFKALHSYTSKLPLVDRHGDLPKLGYNTETAIRSGVVKGVFYEIDSYIEDYKLRYPNIQVILTGGHSDFIKSQLKNNIFVEQNLILKGLNRILNYNVRK